VPNGVVSILKEFAENNHRPLLSLLGASKQQKKL